MIMMRTVYNFFKEKLFNDKKESRIIRLKSFC